MSFRNVVPNDCPLTLCETFSFILSLLAMFFGDRFYMHRKSGTGEVGGCTERV